MVYTANDLFIDEAEIAAMFSVFLRKRAENITAFITKLIDIDYYYYLTLVLQNLPEAIVIVFVGFFAVFNLLKITESNYGNRFCSIITSSMFPEIKPGSMIYSTKLDIYKVGDIVSYVEKTEEGVHTGRVLTHRIIDETDGGTYFAKGDANPNPDPLAFSKQQIQGKVAFVFPFLGYLEVLTKTLPGFLILIAAPSLFILLRQFKEVKKIVKLS